jgi:hypothetical protein
LRVSERAHLRRQIPILVFGFLKPFEVVWRHVLVARGQNADVVVFPPTRLTLSYKIIVRLTSVLKSKNLSSGFPIVLKTIQLMSAAAIGPRLLVMQHS